MYAKDWFSHAISQIIKIVCYTNVCFCTDYVRGANSVPMAVKYLFDYLDYEAHSVGMTDPDVVHVWKNNR